MQKFQIWSPEGGIKEIEQDEDFLSSKELIGIKAAWKEQADKLKDTPQLADFNAKLAREWSIETGIIENIYDIERGVTQTLIEHGFIADLITHGTTNKPVEYVIRVLKAQQDTLEGVFDFVSNRRNLSTSYIKEIHSALLRHQDTTDGMDGAGNFVKIPLIKGEWKIQKNFPIRDGVRYEYCPPEHVAREMERLVEYLNLYEEMGYSAEIITAWLHHRFSQIHPFQDGNGRVARTLASLILIKNGLFPLIITRDLKADYISALENADRGDLKPLVNIISKQQMKQFWKATYISAEISNKEGSLSDALNRLKIFVSAKNERQRNDYKNVKKHALKLTEEVLRKFNSICDEIANTLLSINPNSECRVEKSNDENDYFYRGSIIKNANENLDYFVDFSEFRSWVSLSMFWQHKAKLVFSFHGMGRTFTGGLICAPFFEFTYRDDDGHTQSELVPVAEKGFPFFYNEKESELIARFNPWVEDTLKTAISELINRI